MIDESTVCFVLVLCSTKIFAVDCTHFGDENLGWGDVFDTQM